MTLSSRSTSGNNCCNSLKSSQVVSSRAVPSQSTNTCVEFLQLLTLNDDREWQEDVVAVRVADRASSVAPEVVFLGTVSAQRCGRPDAERRRKEDST
ncbi:hypothetical protein S83_039600, partial [Arachis hypogaea]